MSAQNVEIATRFFEEFCNRGSMDLAGELFAAGHTYHDPASKWVGPGPEGMRQLISAYRSAFPDAHWNVEEAMTAGDRVITRWTAGGTNRNELMGIPATGKSGTVTGIWIHRRPRNHSTINESTSTYRPVDFG